MMIFRDWVSSLLVLVQMKTSLSQDVQIPKNAHLHYHHQSCLQDYPYELSDKVGYSSVCITTTIVTGLYLETFSYYLVFSRLSSM